MRPLSPRRFPDRITRLREAPGRWNEIGEWEPGAAERVELRASVQPMKLDDLDAEGGVRARERFRVYVLPRRERVGYADAALTLTGAPLTLGGKALTLGLGAEVIDDHALAAALREAGADWVEWLGVVYVVESSRSWGTFTRAVVFRET